MAYLQCNITTNTMRKSATLRALGTTLLLSSATLSVRAQAFIPDTLMRGWLNQAIPGIVDANGIMDTLHPGIAALDTFKIQDNAWTFLSYVDLTGLEFLDSTLFFSFHTGSAVFPALHIPPFPASLETFALDIFVSTQDTLRLPALKNPLKKVIIRSFFDKFDLIIDEVRDTLDLLDLNRVRSLWMNGTQGHIRTLNARLTEYPDLTLPAVNIGRMIINFEHIAEADLSNAAVRYLRVQNTWSQSYNDVFFPTSCDTLDLALYTVNIPTLAEFPLNLKVLDISVGSVNCLPHLPNGLKRFTISSASTECIPNWPDSLQQYSGPVDLYQNPIICSILNTACPGTGSGLGGMCYLDTDGDGVLDPGEPPMTYGVVNVQNSMYLAPAGVDGRWQRSVPPGSYTMVPATSYPYVASILPLQHFATLPAYGDVDSVNHFGYTLIPNMQDLVANFSTWVARPGFDNTLWLNYRNYGTTVVNGELSFTFDSDQTWVSSSVPPTTLVGNTATWSFPNMPINTQGNLTVTLHTATTVPLGTPIIHTLTFDPVATDQTPWNNAQLWTDSVVGSYDPNDKLLSPAVMSPADVLAGDMPITYTIRFQNTGSFPAERVVILDTLSADLKWESMRFLGSSHPCQWYIDEGVLHVVFDPIQLPDSTSDEPGSHGMVMFSMLPNDQLQSGSTVTNVAHIVFDFNAPIITPPAVFAVDIASNVASAQQAGIRVYPVPAHDRITVAGLREGRASYRVNDLMGRLVLSGSLDPRQPVDVSSLTSGAYVLVISTDDLVHRCSFQKQ